MDRVTNPLTISSTFPSFIKSIHIPVVAVDLVDGLSGCSRRRGDAMSCFVQVLARESKRTTSQILQQGESAAILLLLTVFDVRRARCSNNGFSWPGGSCRRQTDIENNRKEHECHISAILVAYTLTVLVDIQRFRMAAKDLAAHLAFPPEFVINAIGMPRLPGLHGVNIIARKKKAERRRNKH